MASLQSESGIHASQMGIPSSTAVGDGPQDGGQQAQKSRKTKLQLWNDLKISCGCISQSPWTRSNIYSNHTSIHPNLYPRLTHASHPDTIEPLRKKKLPIKCSITSNRRNGANHNQPREPRRRQPRSSLRERF